MATTKQFQIRRASSADLPCVRRLLESSDLPCDGIDDALNTLLVATQDGKIVGSAALEIYGENALLRSVAVGKAARSKGLGHQLTEEILLLGDRLGINRTFLLTETAENYFPRFGFTPVDREAIPSEVKDSVEFTSACPESALAMERTIS